MGDAPLVAHNAKFDLGFLNAELERCGRALVAGERLDEIAHRYYGSGGHPSLWRWLAAYNNISDPLNIPAGFALQIPRLSDLEALK